jgi:predicted metal-binding protein
MSHRKRLESLFSEHGYSDYKWIDPVEIEVAQWVRMHCMFGCSDYGRNASCPPNTPSVSECREFIREYTSAVVFHFHKAVDNPEDRYEWSRRTNLALLDLERAVFLSGHEKAFLLFMDNCRVCAECTSRRVDCKNPDSGRPSAEAMAVDVFSTVKKLGYPIEVLDDHHRAMNRYAFMLIE